MRRYQGDHRPWNGNFEGSAAAADPLEEEVPLVVDVPLRWVDMTLWEEILEGQNWGPLVFWDLGPSKKDSP